MNSKPSSERERPVAEAMPILFGSLLHFFFQNLVMATISSIVAEGERITSAFG